MEPQVPLDSEACLHPVHILIKHDDCGVPVSSQNHEAHNPAKKQPRQWAAWTRREEESFFTALRQVGKNFEKITFRVQSKNKDQVRHYYYRLVRRMNKLLGPGLCLDAKNSKDTNAAMLRWWSLLEKYSCKASKLHLKPRRFKIFIENLENQLLKDRKKGKRKQPSQGENRAPTIPVTISNPDTASGHDDTHAVKLVLVENQSFKQLGPLKGPSLRRNVNVGINYNNFKGDSLPPKPVRQRRRPGTTAAYKRWEKAAIAGVSLVADAAEHLERATIDKEAELVQATLVEKCFDPVGKDSSPLPTSSPNLLGENNTQASIIKLKLQLFPIDEGTRRALEMDNHNPHLELTLTTRKKISSVLEHLNRKWGNSSVVSGDLMLFPFFVQKENLVGYPRWTQDSVVSASDVYAAIGCPPVFRLRYGWFCNSEPVSATSQTPSTSSDMIHNLNMMNVTDAKEQSEDSLPIVCQPEKLSERCNNDQVSLDRRETENGAICRAAGSKDDQRLRNAPSLSVGEWADSLTNISVGDLLADASHDAVANCGDSPILGSSQCLQQGSFICDSFDAAIAAHINRHQDKTIFPPDLVSISSSIWDAEETCDAFSFQNTHRSVHTASGITSLEACKQIGQMSSVGFGATVKELTEVEEPMDENPGEGIEGENPGNTDPMDECLSDPPILEDSEKDLNAFTDIDWPESLGPLDLDVPSSRYHTEDVSFSDSLTGLNRLLNNSPDAFQNCSFFGLDKKEMASTVEAQETASFSDFKVGSGV